MIKSIEQLFNEQGKINIDSDLYLELKSDFSYHSSAIEGSTVTKEDNDKIIKFNSNFDTETIAINYENKYEHDEVIENFNCGNLFEYILVTINQPITEKELKIWHNILKKGTKWAIDYSNSYGEYKKYSNSIGNIKTPEPWQIPELMQELLNKNMKVTTIEQITEFHAKFESIHPFLDGNGRIGRGIILKQCLENNLFPIIINNIFKNFYYDGLKRFQQTGNIDLLLIFFNEQQKIFEKKYDKYFRLK